MTKVFAIEKMVTTTGVFILEGNAFVDKSIADEYCKARTSDVVKYRFVPLELNEVIRF